MSCITIGIRKMILLCYLALTVVAASMLMEDGQGLLFDPFRAGIVAFIGGMACWSVPIMMGAAFGAAWADIGFYSIAALSACLIALYVASDRYVRIVVRRREQEEAAREEEARRLREMDPVLFAAKWVPELKDATGSAVTSIAGFMERTEDTYDDAAIDVRILAGHVPEIVRLANEAIARQDESFRAYTARSAIDRVIAIGRAVDKAAATLRTPEDEALEARLRYVDVKVDDRFSAIA